MNDLPEIEFNQSTVRLGCLVNPGPSIFPPLRLAPAFRCWSQQEVTDAIRAKKPKLRRGQFAGDKWIVNQRSLGSCNPAAATGAMRRAFALNGRNDIPLLSWEFVYAQLVDGRDVGSMLDAGMDELRTLGAPPLNPHARPLNRDYRKRDYSAAEYQAAKLYTARDTFVVESELELATCLLSGQGAGVVAVHVGNSFTSLDADGFAGADRGQGNHAVGVEDVEIIDGELAFDMVNSWGLDFGEDGHCYLSWRRHLAQTRPYHQFYVILNGSNPNADGPTAS